MRFYIVHELRGISTPHSGRMRVRASCPLGLAQAEALAGALATLPGISEIRVNPRLGSLFRLPGGIIRRKLTLASF